ncbi:DUF6580 family putative transport protein [Mucilaginibacter sp. AK015]|uniref:DUF6580 family putative transport protein n=1 Tax=Mucilaginibacter sp. AK015 TaxID=2723072 RepID=UPI00161A7AA2|nr:DUF6580 family putative transport protein [Mucilaginibacter sp. AK015]MBB5394328.1 hypothetical protein [Mucilaginibacter sp. AK015]
MSLHKINTRNSVLILIILAATAMRLVNTQVPLLSNFTPVGAIALFAGAYFNDKWKAYLIPMLSLFVSDIFVNYIYTYKLIVFTGSSLWVYGCFMLMVLVGTFIKKVNIVSVAAASVVSVMIHWLIMDLPFLYGTFYPHTLAGYGQSLTAAIYPFETNMLIADALYGAILFGGFELAKRKYTSLQTQRQLAL